MKKIYQYLLLFFCSINLLNAQPLVYDAPIVRQSKGGMHVEQVILTDTATIIKAFCINDTYKPSALISTAKPGTNNAFRLIAQQSFYQLQAVDGIPLGSESISLPFGDSVFFELRFKAIPANTKVIDLVEGANQVESAWMLYGVQLCDKMFKINGHETMFNSPKDFETYFEENKRRLWEIEGFWEVDSRLTTRDESIQKQFLKKRQRVAIVRENNSFNVYDMNGNKIDLHFKHYRREKYVINFPISAVYPVQRTFKYKIKFDISFKLANRHLKALDVKTDFKGNRVYYDATWQFVGMKGE